MNILSIDKDIHKNMFGVWLLFAYELWITSKYYLKYVKYLLKEKHLQENAIIKYWPR